MPAAPAAEPSTVPGQIFSREKQLSHRSLRSVPTSPAARDAREFTEDRRSHRELAGLVCLSANHSKPAESISLARDLSAACPQGRAGETAGGQGPDLPFNQAELLWDAPVAWRGTAEGTGSSIRKWSFEAHCEVLSQIRGGSSTKAAAGREETEAWLPEK